jgi:cytochrome c553
MRLMLVVFSSIAILFLTLLPGATGLAGTKAVGPPDVAWKDMTYTQRREYMKAAVMPKMKPIFKKFDGKTFADFTCETCHGTGASKRKYKMPSPDIKALPSTPEAFQAKLKTEPTWPKWTKFMAGEVEPTMAALLGVPAFNPEKPDKNAFSCAGCHKVEATAPAATTPPAKAPAAPGSAPGAAPAAPASAHGDAK